MTTKLPGLGGLIASYRAGAHLSQWQLATRSGVARSYLQRLEAGQQHPSRDVVEALADAMTLDGYDRALLISVAGYIPLDDPAFTQMVAAIARHWAAREIS